MAPATSFAASVETHQLNGGSKEKSVVMPRSVVNPSYYDKTIKAKYLTVKDLDIIYDRIKRYKNNNNFQEIMGVISYIAGFFPELALFSMSTGTASMMKSDIQVENMVDVIYNQQRAMRETGWTTRNTGFVFKRFYNGHTNVMGDWYLADLFDATNF